MHRLTTAEQVHEDGSYLFTAAGPTATRKR